MCVSFLYPFLPILTIENIVYDGHHTVSSQRFRSCTLHFSCYFSCGFVSFGCLFRDGRSIFAPNICTVQSYKITSYCVYFLHNFCISVYQTKFFLFSTETAADLLQFFFFFICSEIFKIASS